MGCTMLLVKGTETLSANSLFLLKKKRSLLETSFPAASSPRQAGCRHRLKQHWTLAHLQAHWVQSSLRSDLNRGHDTDLCSLWPQQPQPPRQRPQDRGERWYPERVWTLQGVKRAGLLLTRLAFPPCPCSPPSRGRTTYPGSVSLPHQKESPPKWFLSWVFCTWKQRPLTA